MPLLGLTCARDVAVYGGVAVALVLEAAVQFVADDGASLGRQLAAYLVRPTCHQLHLLRVRRPNVEMRNVTRCRLVGAYGQLENDESYMRVTH